MMGRGTARNMQSATPKINLEISVSGWFLLKRFGMMHGHMNVKIFQKHCQGNCAKTVPTINTCEHSNKASGSINQGIS